jgi:CheY-like chemotaxis protein
VVQFEVGFGRDEIMVSHIRVENDPWQEVSNWTDGEVKVMEVLARTGTQALGLIQPGIRGRVRFNSGGTLWRGWGKFGVPLPGDEIAGCFRTGRVDQANRIVELDVPGYVCSEVLISEVLRAETEDIAALPNNVISEADDVESDRSRFQRSALGNISRVLIVGDDGPFLNSISGFLVELGFNVTACETAGRAQEACAQTPQPFDLAIIDVHLAKGRRDFEGLTLALTLAEERPSCRIVLVTADELEMNALPARHAADLTISGFIAKPFGVQDLFAALSTAQSHALPLRDFLHKDAAPNPARNGGANVALLRR